MRTYGIRAEIMVDVMLLLLDADVKWCVVAEVQKYAHQKDFKPTKQKKS